MVLRIRLEVIESNETVVEPKVDEEEGDFAVVEEKIKEDEDDVEMVELDEFPN